MKKALTIMLVALMMLSTSAVALADNTTVLTTTVPAATYTLNIPADQTIAFGATNVSIGMPTVTESSGFASGKNLHVAVSYTPFASEGVSTTIPFTMSAAYRHPDGSLSDEAKYGEIKNGDVMPFLGSSNGAVEESPRWPELDTYRGYSMTALFINMSSADWGKALGGEYTATITFTAEVVVE